MDRLGFSFVIGQQEQKKGDEFRGYGNSLREYDGREVCGIFKLELFFCYQASRDIFCRVGCYRLVGECVKGVGYIQCFFLIKFNIMSVGIGEKWKEFLFVFIDQVIKGKFGVERQYN